VRRRARTAREAPCVAALSNTYKSFDMENLIVAVVAYLIGSVSFAVIVSAAMGLADPRSYGSGNPGATNVLRTGNRKAAILTLIGDALKGWLAVWLVTRFGPRYGLDDAAIAIAAIAVFLGHLYPVYFRFKGGKGVATAAGVLLAINPVLGIATLLTWLIVAFFTRYSSLAAICAAIFAPLFDGFLFGANVVALAVVAMSALLIWRHRGNIAKLVAGQESRIGQKKGAGGDAAGGAGPKR
jgi:glycerol-3-phosphate acyltransferase PlsY